MVDYLNNDNTLTLSEAEQNINKMEQLIYQSN